jgi:hypothetical protein
MNTLVREVTFAWDGQFVEARGVGRLGHVGSGFDRMRRHEVAARREALAELEGDGHGGRIGGLDEQPGAEVAF